MVPEAAMRVPLRWRVAELLGFVGPLLVLMGSFVAARLARRWRLRGAFRRAAVVVTPVPVSMPVAAASAMARGATCVNAASAAAAAELR